MVLPTLILSKERQFVTAKNLGKKEITNKGSYEPLRSSDDKKFDGGVGDFNSQQNYQSNIHSEDLLSSSSSSSSSRLSLYNPVDNSHPNSVYTSPSDNENSNNGVGSDNVNGNNSDNSYTPASGLSRRARVEARLRRSPDGSIAKLWWTFVHIFVVGGVLVLVLFILFF
jgi:hypothetical protein